jgi:serine protease
MPFETRRYRFAERSFSGSTMLSVGGDLAGNRVNSSFAIRRVATSTLTALALTAGAAAVAPQAAGAADYVPGVVLVGYASSHTASVAADIANRHGVRESESAGTPTSRMVRVPRGLTVAQEIARLRRQHGVVYAVPDYRAHIAGGWIPNDRGRTNVAQGWQRTQWNFLSTAGVNAPRAWANLFAVKRGGAKGVVVAVLDTGVAYRNWHQFRRSPDFARTHFKSPYDFIANNRYALDREGHGTFVTGVIAESANNVIGLTGLAYGATIMPVRVLDSGGLGDAATISKGIRYAVTHGAQVINLSLEFDPTVTAGDIPDIVSAIRFAHDRGAVVVGASGNEGETEIAYPARDSDAISVGATTLDRCLADYSNGGAKLDLVAPGGGNDTSSLPNDPACHPDRNLPDLYQMTFANSSHPGRFSFPGGWYGTSMAAPEVSAAAAMVIASGVIGRRPTPAQILARLESTTQSLGGAKPNDDYGYGLLDIGAATSRTAGAAPK